MNTFLNSVLAVLSALTWASCLGELFLVGVLSCTCMAQAALTNTLSARYHGDARDPLIGARPPLTWVNQLALKLPDQVTGVVCRASTSGARALV